MHASIGITSGDPAGIGLEVVLKSLPHVMQSSRWILFTTRRAFEKHSPSIPYRWIESPRDIEPDVLNVYAVSDGDPAVTWGRVDRRAGAEALACLEAAATAAMNSH